MSKQAIYGFPCVTDPNDFLPDYESCAPAEIEAHKLACATYGTPLYQPNKGCTTEHDESGQMVKHILRTSWGIGTNLIQSCDGCRMPGFMFDEPLMTCYDCGGHQEFCGDCWAAHAKECEP